MVTTKHEAFIYLWYDAPNKMYYLGKHKGTPDDGYTHSSTIWESFTKDNIPKGARRRILAYGTDKEICLLEHELLKNRKKRCWHRYYNNSLGDPRYVVLSGENHYRYKHGEAVGWKNDKSVRQKYLQKNKAHKKAYDKEYNQKNKAKRAEYYQKNKAKRAEWLQKNKEVIKAQQAEYYQKNKAKILAQQAEYYQKNKAQQAEYRQKNKAKILAYQVEHYQKNKAHKKAQQAEYYQKNKVKILAQQAEYRQKYYQKNKVKILAQQAEYRQRKKLTKKADENA